MAPASSVRRRFLPLATLLVAAVLNPLSSSANPTGANVTGGAATVSGQGTSRVTIDQSSDRAFIEWNSFSVAKGESVRFIQPSASSVTANKVVGVAPSEILGAVSANGRIILINPNGVFFGKGSTVDAAGLIATTLDLDKDSFLAGGKLKFSSASDLSASVVNEGTLTINDAGLGALVAPHVRNSGALVANLGTAVLASGKAFTVDFAGDGLITFALGEGIASTLVGADGQPLKAQVEQAGEVAAGRIVLSAAAAREVVNQSVNVSGLVRAGSAGRNADGSISLRGSNSVAVAAGAEISGAKVTIDADNVSVSGQVSAGSLQLTGDQVSVLTGAALSTGGGSILVGGDWQGSNGVRQALTTTLEAGAMIDAGQGGKVVLWSDVTNANSVTTVAGTVRALGGRIETSGHVLELPGVVQAGIGGTWLLDPTNVTITTTSSTGTLAGDLANAGLTNIKATDIQTAVNAGSSVTVLATGTFTLSTPLAFAPAVGVTGSLTLNNLAGTMGASTNVTIATTGGVSNSGLGAVNFNIFSNGTITLSAPIASTNGPINVALQSANQTTSNTGVANNISISSNITTRGGYLVIDATGGTINGLGTSAPSITRGADLATSGKGGSISINAAMNTTTSGAAVSATTPGGNLVVATSGQFGLQTQTLGRADIGGSATLSLKGGNQSNTNGAYCWLLGTGTGYFKARGDIIADARTPFALNTTIWVQGAPITSYAGSITLYSSTAGSVGGFGQMAIQAPITAYGPITIQALGEGNVLSTTYPTLTSTAAGTITSSTGLVSIAVTGKNSGVYATTLAGLITGPQVAITATNSAAGGLGISMIGSTSGVTITADAGTTYPTAGNALSVTATVGTAGVTGGITVTGGNIINQSNGGSVAFVTNGDLTATSAVNFSTANTSTGAQTITYDTRSGNLTSQITTGSFTYNATGATQKVNYVEESNGSNLTIGNSVSSAIALSGYILVDNTNSGVLTPASAIAGMTTAVGVTAQGSLSTGDYIALTGINNSSTLNAVSLGAATLTVTSASSTAAAITVIGNHNVANIGNPGIASTGAMAIQSNGGSFLFQSNGDISQTGAVTLAANTSGVASSVTYDTTSGNKNATITSGSLTLTGGAAASNTAINYIQKSAGAALGVGSLAVPGYILLDNTYGGTAGVGGTATSGYVNLSNAPTYAQSTLDGVLVSGALSSGAYAGTNAISINSVSGLLPVGKNNITVSGALTAATGNINLAGETLASNGVKLAANVSANSGSIDIVGVSSSNAGSGTGIYLNAGIQLASSANITMSGSVTSSTVLGPGIDMFASGNVISAGGNLRLNAFSANASANTMYALRMGISPVYLKSGGDIVISASNGAATAALSAGVIAYGLVTNAGGTLTFQGSTLGARVIATGTSVANVASAAPTTSVDGGAGTGIILNGSASYTDGANTYTGINAIGNISVVGRGAVGGIDDTSILIKSSNGAVMLTGATTTGVAVSDTALITGNSISVIGTASGAAATVVSLKAMTINAGGANLSVLATGGTAGGNTGITQSGAITQAADGGSITFTSNNKINQTGAISMAVNTSGTPSAVTYDTTGGTSASSIVTGALTLAAGSTSAINYALKTAGAPITVGAITMPGSIALDNTYGGTGGVGGTATSGFITSANAGTLATASNGITVSGALSAGAYAGAGGITLNGVTTGTYGVTANAALTSATGAISITGLTTAAAGTGVYLSSATITASGGTYAAGTSPSSDAIRITGTALSGQAAINLAGTTSITNNSTNGNTDLIANVGNFVDPVTITNAASAGAIEVSAIGSTSAITSVAGTVFTQNSNAGIVLATSQNGNLTAPKIANNGTGNVILAAGAYLPVGTGTGGQIVGVSTNTLTSASGNVYLFAGQPGASFTNPTTLAYLNSALGTLSFNNTVFSQAYHTGNVPATSLVDTAINLANLPSANTKTGSSAGPAIQFRVSPSYQMVLSAHLTKVYGTSDPANTTNSVAVAGSLENQLAASFSTPATNPTGLRNNAGTTEIILSVNGTNFYLPLTNFLNSVTGTRTGYGVLAGERAYVVPTSGVDPKYTYSFNSTMGILLTSGVTVSGVAGTVPTSLAITKAPLTVTSYGTNFTYDGVTKYGSLIAVAGLVGAVDGVATGDAVTGATSTFRTGATVGSGTVIANPATTVVNAGTYNGTPSAAVGSGLANYNVSYVGAAFTVAPAPLSITNNAAAATTYDGSSTYGSLFAAAGYTVTGLVASESIASVAQNYKAGAVVGSGTSLSSSSVAQAGSFNVTPSAAVAGAGTSLSNYSITYVGRAYAVDQVVLNNLSLSGANHSLVYNGGLQANYGATVIGLLGSDAVTINGYASGKDVGTYTDALTLTAVGGTNLSNYNILTTQGVLTITAAPLTIVGASTSVVYNAALRTNAAATVTGLRGSDSLTVTGSATGKHVGSYADVLTAVAGSGTSLANYTITTTNGALTVTAAPLTVTGASSSRVYNASTQANSAAAVVGLAGGDTVTVSGYGAGRNVGTYADALTVTAGLGTSLGDYAVTQTNGTLTITPFQFFFGPHGGVGPRIVGAANDKVYDAGTAATGSVNVLGLLGGDTLTATATSAAFDTKNVAGGKTVTFGGVAVQGDATTLANYTLGGTTSVTTTAAVIPAPLSVSASTDTKVYDRTTASSRVPTVTGLLGSDTLTGLTQAFADRNVLGAGASTLVVQNGYVLTDGNNGANYALTVNLAAGTITPRPLSATGITAQNKVYDATTAAALSTTSVQVTGVLAGDVSSINIVIGANVTGTFADANVGTAKAVNLAGISLTGLGSANYTTDGIGGVTADITKAPLTIVGATTSAVYAAALQTNASATITGLRGADAITASGRGAGTNVGTYADSLVAVAVGSTSLGNYNITVTNGSLAITPKALTAVAVANNKVYDAGTATTGSVTLTGLVGTDASTVVAQGSYAFAQSDVGTGLPVAVTGLTLTGAGSGNYRLPGSALTASAAITPAPLNVYANSDGKFYSLTDAAGNAANTSGYNGYAVTGFVGGQTLAVLTGSLAAAGQGITVTRAGITNPAVLGANNVEQAGTYAGALVPAGPAASGNYALNYVAGNFSIAGPGSALIRLVGTSTVPYGAAPASLPVTVSYLSGGSSITSLSLSSATVAGSVISYVFSDVLNNTISFDISAASLPRSTSNHVKVGSYALTSLIGNVDTSHAPSLNGTAVTTAGSYTVTPAAATLAATGSTRVYNGATQTQSATLTGVLAGDLVAYAGVAAGRNVGTYASNLAVSADPATSADAGNYVVTLVNGNLVITPFQLVPGGTPSNSSPGIAATANSRVYDGTTAATGTITPVLFAGDTLTAEAGSATFANKHVGTGKTVTFGGIALVGDAATLANYDLPANLTLTAPADITPATLTVNGLSASNRVYDGTLVATLNTSAATVAGIFAGDTITVAAAGVSGLFADKNVANGIAVTAPSIGSALVAGSGTLLSDYTVNTVTGLSANITQASLTITGVTGVNRAYDGTTAGAVNSTNAQLVGVVAGDAITLVTSGAVGVFADKNAADGIALAVSGNTLTPAAGTLLSNYSLSQPTGITANITKAAVTVTGAQSTVVYDAGTQNNGPATVSGLTAGESLIVAGFSSGRNAGTYADALSVTAGANTSLGNYVITKTNGALTITPFQFFFGPNGGVGPRIVGAANDKVYDAFAAATGTLRVLGLLGADALTATASSSTFDTKNAGSGKTVTFGGIAVHGDATTLANYTLGGTSTVATTAAVTPAPLTVTGSNASLVYNAATQANTAATVAGLVGGETVTLTGYGAGRNVGSYADSLSVSAGANTVLSNYAVTIVNGGLTITPYQLHFGPNSGVGPRVVGAANDKVYDAGTTATGGVSVLGLLGTDTLSATATSATFDTKDVGTGKAVTFAGIALGGDATTLANYTLGSTTTLGATAAVTPAPLTITGVATSLVYNAASQTNALASVSGLIGSETVTLTGYGAGRNVGTYADALTVTAGAGTSLNNYAITKTNGALTITPFQFFFGPNGGVGPRIVGAANDKVYDAFTVATGNVGVFGLLGTDVLTATFTSSTFDTKNAGSGKTVTFGGIAVHGDATTLANYTLGGTTSVTTTAAVTPAPLTITGANTTVVYDATPVSNATATVTGLIGGETVLVSGYGAGRNVGTYADALTPTAGGADTDLNNYAITTVNGALSVTPYQLRFGDLAVGPRVVGSAADKVYDTTVAATGSVSVLGLLGGDVLTASSAAPSFDTKNAGNRKAVTFTGIVLGGDPTTLSNYSLGGITSVTTKASVTPAPLSVVGASTSVVYDGTTQANAAATVTGLLGSEAVTVTGYGSGRNTGTYRDVLVATAGAGTSLDNYFVTTTNGALTVTPYHLGFGAGVTGPRIEATAQGKVYDASVNANGSLTVAGLFAGDVLSATSATSTFDTKDVSPGKTVTFGGVLIGGDAVTLSNYSLSTLPTVTAQADVTPAPLKVNVQSDAKFVTQTDAVGGSGAAGGYNGYQFSGFVGGETAAVLSSPVISVSRAGIANPAVLGAGNVEQAGTYAGALVASGPATAGNYALTYVPADFTVVPAGQLMVKTAGALSVYASGALTPTITSVSYMTSSGGNQIEVLTQTVAGSSGNGYHYTYTDSTAGTVSFALVPVGTTSSHSGNINVGTYALAVADFAKTTPNLTGTGADVVVAGQGIVTAKPVTLTASTPSTQYDATLKAQTFADNGLVANDLVTVAGLRTGTNAGGYRSQLVPGGADAGNYAFVIQDGLMTITPALLTVTGASRSVVYNAASQANAAATVVGLIGNESVTVSGYAAARNVGVYADSLSLAAGAGTSLANYAVTYADGSLTVTPYALSFGDGATGPRVKATANNKVYDTATAATGGLSVLGLLGADTLTATAGAADFDTKNVGTGKTVTFTGILLGGDQATLSNYDLGGVTSVTTTAAVGKAALSVVGVHTSSVYNSFTQANAGATTVGLLGGETASVTGYGSGRNVGSYADHLALTAGAGTLLSNYDITYVNGGLTLTPRALVLTNLSAVNKNYDGGTAAVVHGDLVGVLAGDAVTTGSIVGRFADAFAGQAKTVTVVSGSLLGADAGNYVLTPGQTTFADIIAQNKEIENFILGATKLGDVGIYKDWGLPQFRYPVPKTFIVRPVDAAAPTETTTGDSNAAGPAAKVRYFTGDEKSVDGTGFRYVYPKVNLGKAYYVGALRGDDAKAAGGETTDNVDAK